MRSTAAALTTHRSERKMVHAEWLIWIEARRRSDGASVDHCLWTGTGLRTFSVDGINRDFQGTSILKMPVFHDEVGLRVRRNKISLIGVSPAVETAFRLSDTFNAPISVWRAEFDKDKRLIAPPEREWRGRVETAPVETGPNGEDCTIIVGLISDAWRLTVCPPVTKSPAAQEARNGDKGRRYSNVHDADVEWGDTNPKPPKRKKFLGIF